MKKLVLYLLLLFAPIAMAQAVSPTQHSVTLSWQASTSTTVTHYGVFRAVTSGGPYTYNGFTKGFSLVVTNNPDGTSFVEGAVFYYVVVAFTDPDPVTNKSAHSVDSNEVQVTIPITVTVAPPTNLTVNVQ